MAHIALIVSRDTATVEVLTQIVSQRDIALEHCEDPEEALPLLDEQYVGVLFLDYQSESRAHKLIESIQQNSTQPKPLIVVLANEADKTSDLFDLGVNFLLYKPVTTERAEESLQGVWNLMPPERRRKERISVAAQAAIAFGTNENVQVPILNLSQDGVTIYSASKLPLPCRVYFQFALPGHSSAIRLSGEVIWQDWKGHVGIRFAHVPQTSRRVLDEWLTNNTDRAAHKISGATLTVDRIVVQTGEDEPAQIEKISLSEDERRTAARRTCRLGVNVFLSAGNVLQQCTLTDASAGGCYIETTQPLAVATRLTIEIRTQDAKFHVHGKVRSAHRGYGMGIAFSLATDEERENAEKLMSCLDAKLDIASESILERE